MEEKALYMLEELLERYTPSKGRGHELGILLNQRKAIGGYFKDGQENLYLLNIRPANVGNGIQIYLHDENRFEERSPIEMPDFREAMDCITGVVRQAVKDYQERKRTEVHCDG